MNKTFSSLQFSFFLSLRRRFSHLAGVCRSVSQPVSPVSVSPSLSFYSVCLCLSACLPACLPVSLCLSLSLSVCLSVCLSLSLAFALSDSPSPPSPSIKFIVACMFAVGLLGPSNNSLEQTSVDEKKKRKKGEANKKKNNKTQQLKTLSQCIQIKPISVHASSPPTKTHILTHAPPPAPSNPPPPHTQGSR